MPIALDRSGTPVRDRHGRHRNPSQLCNRCGIRKDVRRVVEFFICGDCKLVDKWYLEMTKEEPCHVSRTPLSSC